MPDVATLRAVIDIVAQTFAVDPAALGRDTVPDDVDGWDSVSHTMLMLALEDRFHTELPFSDTVALPNLGALADYLDARGNRATGAEL